jgi:uncharacterized protein (UPF0303 family)
MTTKDDIAKITEQEKRLVFASFDEADAFAIGSELKALADAGSLPMVIDVALWSRKLFYFARPGTTSDNEDWVRRKVNLVRRLHKSSYRVGREFAEAGITLADRSLPEKDYAAAGGSFPINVKGAGAIGAITISGLPQRDDHNTVVAAIAAHLKIDIADITLA